MDQVIVIEDDTVEVLVKTSRWTNSLLFPIYVAALSAGLFLLHTILLSAPVRQLLYPPRADDPEPENSQRPENENIHVSLWGELKENVKSNGGIMIWSFKVFRLLGVLVLIALSVASAINEPQPAQESTLLDMFREAWGKKRKRKGGKSHLTDTELIELAWVAFYMYSALLALFSVILKPRLRRLATNHLVLLLLVAWGVYMWRDIWPHATFHLEPLDPQTWVTWTIISLLSVVGVLVPLFIPHQYVPVDPGVYVSKQPNDEQTSSWIAFLCYTFLDPLVYEAAKTPHLSYERLPPLADYDRAEWLAKRSFPHLDPMMGVKGHLFFGLMRYFFWDFMALVALIAIKVIVGFAGPLGINRLLLYIETNGEGATVRPWVWISWLFIGPVVGTMAIQWYVFINTRTLVRVEGIITQLIFQHALRIRMKEETPVMAEKKPTPSEGNTAVGTPVPERTTTEHRSRSTSDTGVTDETLQGSTSGAFSPNQTKSKQKDAPPPTSTSPAPAMPADKSAAPSASTPSNLVGRINNFISTDLGNIGDGRDFLFVVWYCPLQVAICVWFLYSILGMASVLGMAVMVISVPLPGLVGAMINRVQTQRMKKTDARVQWVSEVMNVLRMVKLFAWEPKIKQQMLEKREEELTWIKKRQFLQLLNMTLNYALPLLTMIVTFASYTLIFHHKLTPSRVFSSMAVFDMLRDQLHFVLWGVGAVIQAKVSLDRVSEFLNKTELLDMYDSETRMLAIEPSNAPPPDTIGFRNATFTWAKDPSGVMTPGRRNFKLKIEGELFFKPGYINMIVGPTGCGKSSVLMALLSEMHFVPSGPDSWYNLPREDGVSYTAQESWVQNETIKENILFGAPYDEERYKKVLHQCALEEDLELFEAGDETEVGEKGLTLSGGQKARVTLARAIYSRTAIILLDDVLSALDVHTGSWIVEKCFKGDLVQGRTVIIVTHNVSVVSKVAQYVVSIGLDGRVISQGTLAEALAHDSKLLAEVAKESKLEEKKAEVVDPPEEDEKLPKKEGKLVVAEEVALGRVSWPALKLYLFSLGGGVFWFAFLGGFLLSDISSSIQTFWLGWWAKQYTISDNVDVFYYLGVYSSLLIGTMFVYCTAYAVYIYGSIRASRSIHNQLSDSILGTTLRWLDKTPVGRVISRFTMDIRAVDGPIASYLSDFVELTITLLVKLCAVIYMSPVFAIPGAIVFGLGGWLGNQYIKAQLSVKREMSNARSPLFSHFNAAIAGLTSIRAYGAQEAFKQQCLQRIDKYTRAARTFYNLNRWVCVRIDALGGAFAAGLGAYVIYGRGMTSNDAGFSLTMAVAFSGMILWWVRVGNEFEVACNSLERIESFIQCEQEPKSTESGKPPAYWPSTGALVIEKLSASYSVDGPEVLHNITLEIKSGERIGVVGRTGSGKSSLTLSLLRLIPTKGAVMYDGIITDGINLNALRTNMTIIPQQPELLSGTIRDNLDPFGDYDDATLNDALRASGLDNVQSEDEESRVTLDTPVSSGGGNFSLGQRQILALARAICRKSKILILDEATAAIDYDTDTLIQASIRTELKDVTVITVAHRLKTIGDCDRVIVLDAGHLVEFDTPANLLKNENGFFRSLVDNSGDREELYRMAGAKP